MKCSSIFLSIALGAIVPTALVFAQEKEAAAAPAPAKPEQVTVITSKRLVMDHAKGMAVFDENVVVLDRDMKMLSDRLTVNFDENDDIDHILAEGKVYIEQDNTVARSNKADYDVKTGLITLTEDPLITRGRDVIKGTVIRFWRDQDRMVVENVQMNIHSKKGDRKSLPPGK